MTKSRAGSSTITWPTWIGVGAGTIKREPEFILDYWAAPLHWADDQGNQWFLDAPAVVGVLRAVAIADCTATATRTPRCPTKE